MVMLLTARLSAIRSYEPTSPTCLPTLEDRVPHEVSNHPAGALGTPGVLSGAAHSDATTFSSSGRGFRALGQTPADVAQSGRM